MASSPRDWSRRAALKTIGAGLGAASVWPYLSDEGAAAFAARQASSAPAVPVFLTAAQHAAVDAITEAIIPADDHSPGARGARVADYVDLLLSEAPAETQQAWVAGLSALDALVRARFSRPFAELTAAEATGVLTELARNEASPRTPLEVFFRDTKEATIRGYYTSEIGIHRELTYKGNQALAEFVGCTHPEHGFGN